MGGVKGGGNEEGDSWVGENAEPTSGAGGKMEVYYVFQGEKSSHVRTVVCRRVE